MGEQFRKPCDIAFRILQRRWKLPFPQLMYVGDNAEMDFLAPTQLGMRGVYFRNHDGLYSGSEVDGVKTIDTPWNIIPN